MTEEHDSKLRRPEDGIPAEALAQVRQLYADLVEHGATPGYAREQVGFATLANGLYALCIALNEVVAPIYQAAGRPVPEKIDLMIGHAHTASMLATRIVNGALPMEIKNGE